MVHGSVFLVNCPFQMEAEFRMINNTALLHGGAVHAQNSRLIFNGPFFNISNNSAKSKGGGLFLQNVFTLSPVLKFSDMKRITSLTSRIHIPPPDGFRKFYFNIVL